MTFILCVVLFTGAVFGVQSYHDASSEKKQLKQVVAQKNLQIKHLNQTVKRLKAKSVSDIDGVAVTDLQN